MFSECTQAFTKPFFNGIEIKARIPVFVPNPAYEGPSFDAHSAIPLNPDLVCIIGGRGTGKSCLVDYLRNSFGGNPRKAEYVYSQEFAILFNKDFASQIAHNAHEGAELPFVYISQSEVKSKIIEGTVGSEIKEMLGVQELAFDLDLDTKISELLGNVSTHVNWFQQKNEKGEIINDEEETKRQLFRFESLLTSITTEQNKEKLERFTANITTTSTLKEKAKKLTAFAEELRAFQVKANATAQSLDQRVPIIDLTTQIATIKLLAAGNLTQVAKCDLDNETIRTDFAQVYTGDLAGLLQNAESYRNSIEKLRSRLTEINLTDLFYDLEQRSSCLFVEPQISYSGTPLERLSVGQKGTVYLCLKLATQTFSQPLIFDQPEDDLDNEFIIAELIGIFRGIKQFRQVIVVTHNANLVVNSDAEQVIVAQNTNGVLQYISGSLENKSTNEAVRRILESGDEAFRKRELRYNLPE